MMEVHQWALQERLENPLDECEDASVCIELAGKLLSLLKESHACRTKQ
jgi:hypothetical protein